MVVRRGRWKTVCARGAGQAASRGRSTSPLAAMTGRSVLFGACVILTLGATPVPTAKSQCEELLNVVLPFAEKMLAAHGEFYPFGASMKLDGQIVQVAAYEGREHPPSQPLIAQLREAFTAEARSGSIIASATAYDVRTIPPGSTTKSDAVAIELDHRDRYSVVVFFPYAIQGRTVRVGTAFTEKGEFRIFGHGS